jgi:predicted Zn-dependent protease
MARVVNHARLLADALTALQAGAAAALALKRLTVFSPGFPGAYLAWGDRVARSKSPGADAVLLRRALCAAPGDSRAHLGLADARRHARDAALIDPASTAAYQRLATVAVHRNDHAAAVGFLSRSRCIAPLRNPDVLILMRALFELDRLSDCARAARRYLTAVPRDPVGYTMLGRTLARQQKHARARVQVDRLEKLTPGDPTVILAKARIALSRRRHDQAIRLFRCALVVRPGDGLGTFDLARGLWKLERFADAERAMLAAAWIDPAFGIRNTVLRLSATDRDFKARSP